MYCTIGHIDCSMGGQAFVKRQFMPSEISYKTNIEMPNFWVVIVMQNSWVGGHSVLYNPTDKYADTEKEKNIKTSKQTNKEKKC